MRRMPRLALEGATRGRWVGLGARRMMTLGLGLMSETEPYCRWTAPARQIILAIEIWSTVARLIEFPSPTRFRGHRVACGYPASGTRSPPERSTQMSGLVIEARWVSRCLSDRESCLDFASGGTFWVKTITWLLYHPTYLLLFAPSSNPVL